MEIIYFSVSITLIHLLIGCHHVTEASPKSLQRGECGDASWAPFSDSKCFKVVETFESWGGAVDACKYQGDISSFPVQMATIQSAEEQAFVTNLVFNNTGIVNNVWIKARRPDDGSSPDFSWIDGQPIDFNNWAEGAPGGIEDGKNCVEMESGQKKEIVLGLWRDVSCARGNWVLCERLQEWNAYEVHTIILEMRKQIEHLQCNPVPLGFIYTELPGHPAPQEIWPHLTWEDVSASLAGNFFRVLGGDSAEFGSLQAAAWSRISEVGNNPHFDNHGITLPLSGWSANIFSGENEQAHPVGMRFYVEQQENRPINTAVRLWKRTA